MNRAALLSEPQRQFFSMGIDGSGRLFVQGEDAVSGLSFADVFAETTFLGRITLPCRVIGASMWISGAWMAILCSEENADTGVQLRAFRIVSSERGQ